MKLTQKTVSWKYLSGTVQKSKIKITDQNWNVIFKDIMRRSSFLVKLEAFSLQLCYQPTALLKINSFTGIVQVFFVLFRNTRKSHKHICHKKWKDNQKTQAKTAVSCSYVENQAILEPILFYVDSKCKQNQRQGSMTVYGPTF